MSASSLESFLLQPLLHRHSTKSFFLQQLQHTQQFVQQFSIHNNNKNKEDCKNGSEDSDIDAIKTKRFLANGHSHPKLKRKILQNFLKSTEAASNQNSFFQTSLLHHSSASGKAFDINCSISGSGKKNFSYDDVEKINDVKIMNHTKNNTNTTNNNNNITKHTNNSQYLNDMNKLLSTIKNNKNTENSTVVTDVIDDVNKNNNKLIVSKKKEKIMNLQKKNEFVTSLTIST